MMQSIENKIKNRIYGKGRGWCFTPKSFEDLGQADNVRQVLKRLETKGFIRRLGYGIYDYPRVHKKLGMIPPDVDKIAEAISFRDKVKIQPSGAYAANLLGLTNQVPARYVFLTEGASRKLLIANIELIFRKSPIKNMAPAGTFAGLVIQSLKNIKKEYVTNSMIYIIKSKMNKKSAKELKKYVSYAPAWISKIIKNDLLGE